MGLFEQIAKAAGTTPEIVKIIINLFVPRLAEALANLIKEGQKKAIESPDWYDDAAFEALVTLIKEVAERLED